MLFVQETIEIGLLLNINLHYLPQFHDPLHTSLKVSESQIFTKLLNISASPSSLAALTFNASLSARTSFNFVSSACKWSTRLRRDTRAARVLSLRFWTRDGLAFEEGERDEVFGERDNRWLLSIEREGVIGG